MFKLKMKAVKAAVTIFVLALGILGFKMIFADQDIEAIQTMNGEKRENGSKQVLVLYGQEIKKELETFGDLLVYEQEFSKEFIYDQSTWTWMPFVKDAKKSLITNKLVMNKKHYVKMDDLMVSFDEGEKDIIFHFELKETRTQVLKDVMKSGIDKKQSEKGIWGEELPTQITEEDEKKYQKEVEETELTVEEHEELKKQFSEKMTSILEVINNQKKTQKTIKVEVN